jgi:hypothetical protein
MSARALHVMAKAMRSRCVTTNKAIKSRSSVGRHKSRDGMAGCFVIVKETGLAMKCWLQEWELETHTQRTTDSDDTNQVDELDNDGEVEPSTLRFL